MSKENSSIHDFDLNIICDYYSNLERQGPGSTEITLKALSFIKGLDKDSKIADIGCGSGGQTITLAKHTEGQLIGIDMFQKFIDLLNANAKKAKLQDRLQGQVGQMENLSFAEESLDLIWSEGAIYNIGFERGLKEWRRFLKEGGYIAVSEASWFTEERPKEIEDFWEDAYPGIDTIPNKVLQMQKAGYVPVASFILPESCWTEDFYAPQKQAMKTFLEEHKGDKAVEGFILNQQEEIDLYEQYKAYYGYVFYIGQKI